MKIEDIQGSDWLPEPLKKDEDCYFPQNVSHSEEINYSRQYIYLRVEVDNIDDCITTLKNMIDLRRLTIIGSYANKKLIKCISEIDTLECLSIRVRRADDFMPISKLTNLTNLVLEPIKNESSLVSFTRLTKLRGLQIRVTKSVTCLDGISKNTWPELKSLFLYSNSYNSIITLDSLKPICNLKNLIFFRLAFIRCRDLDLKCLLCLPNLKFIYIDVPKRWSKESFEAIRNSDIIIIK